MSYSQTVQKSPDSFAAADYYESVSPLNKTAKFLFNVDTGRVAVVRGNPSTGQALVFSESNTGIWNDPDELTFANMTEAGEILPGTTGPQSASSGLRFVSPAPGITQLSLGNTSVVAGVYGDSSNIPSITFNQQGQAIAASNVPLSVPAGNFIASVPTRTIRAGDGTPVAGSLSTFVGDGAGSFGAVSIGTRGTFIGADTGPVINTDTNTVALGTSVRSADNSVAAGANTTSPVNGVSIGGSITSAGVQSVSIGRSITANASDCIAIGSTLNPRGSDNIQIGRNIGTASAALSSTGNIFIGRIMAPNLTTGAGNIVLGATAASVLTTGVNNVFIGNSVAPNTTTGGSNVVIGQQARVLDSVGGTNTVVGTLAQGSDTAVALGWSSQANGQRSIAIGLQAASANQFGISIGSSVSTLATRSFAIGESISNSVGNSLLMGTNTAPTDFVARSTGVLKSYQSVGAAAGRRPVDANQVIVAYPANLLIFNTRYQYPVLVSGNNINLGTHPDDRDSTFSITTTISGTSSISNAVYRFELVWVSPPLADAVVAYQTKDVVNSTDVSLCLAANIRVPPTSTGVNSVYLRVDKLTGPAATLTVVDYRLQVNRLA